MGGGVGGHELKSEHIEKLKENIRQRNHVTSHGQKVMCQNCLKAGFTLRTPDPIKCNAVKCGKLLPRSKFDANDVKTEKKRKDAICSECKKGDRKSGKRKSM